MKTITISQIQNIVCDYYNIPIDATQTKSRKRELSQVRQITMYFAKIKTKECLREIGLQVAGLDHATVIHACKTINNLIDTDKDFKYDVYLIDQELINLEKKILDELEIMNIEIAAMHDYFPCPASYPEIIKDMYDFFPHPGSYPEIEFTTVKFFRPKLWTMKFRIFKTKVAKELESIKNIVSRPVRFSPYAGVESCTNREYHGYTEHAL